MQQHADVHGLDAHLDSAVCANLPFGGGLLVDTHDLQQHRTGCTLACMDPHLQICVDYAADQKQSRVPQGRV